MSCDHELANEWARFSGKNAGYITKYLVVEPRARAKCPYCGTVRMLIARDDALGANHGLARFTLITTQRPFVAMFAV